MHDLTVTVILLSSVCWSSHHFARAVLVTSPDRLIHPWLRDGQVDLLELMRAVYKWAPLATTHNDSLVAARDAALDFFLLLGADPIRRASVA